METEQLIIVSYKKRYIESWIQKYSPLHPKSLTAEQLHNRRGVMVDDMGPVLDSEWTLMKVRWDDAPERIDMVLSCNLSFT